MPLTLCLPPLQYKPRPLHAAAPLPCAGEAARALHLAAGRGAYRQQWRPRAFLTQKIDDCGQTVALQAFDLVRQVLNPDCFVRREHTHKSCDQSLGSAITSPESQWTAEGSLVHRQWDFQGTWTKYKRNWPALNKYEELHPDTVKYFCEKDQGNGPQKIKKIEREGHAKYSRTDNSNLDKDFSMPAIAFRKARAKDKKTQILLQILAELPDDNESDTCIRRWETFRSKFSGKAWVNVLQNPISRWTFDQTIDEKNDEFEEGSNCNLQVLCSPK